MKFYRHPESDLGTAYNILSLPLAEGVLYNQRSMILPAVHATLTIIITNIIVLECAASKNKINPCNLDNS